MSKKNKDVKTEKEETKIKTNKVYFFPKENKTVKADSLEEAKTKLK